MNVRVRLHANLGFWKPCFHARTVTKADFDKHWFPAMSQLEALSNGSFFFKYEVLP